MSIRMKVICRKDKQKPDGTAPVHIRFTQNRKIRYVSTGVVIPLNAWNPDNQSIKTEFPNHIDLQRQIDNKKNEYIKKIQKLEILGVEISLDTVLEPYGKKVLYTLGDCLRKEIERLEILGKYPSASKHKSALSLLNQFRTAEILLENIDLSYLRDFELFLWKKGNKSNSVATKFSLLKAVYNKAMEEELFISTSNPFAKFKIGKLWTATRKRAISKMDIQALAEYVIPDNINTPYTELARDIFLFSYFTAGINIGDIARLKHQNIVNGRLYYFRHKTQKELSYLLLPQALTIIEKYTSENHSPEDYIFPILNKNIHLTEQQQYNRIHKALGKINAQLKILGQAIGLTVPLTSYVARHTYATVLKRSGVPTSIISASLGHSSEKVTQIYLDSFGCEQIDEAMKNL